MAPGCYTAQESPVQEPNYATLKNVVPPDMLVAAESVYVNLDEIPLPASPPPARPFDTVDSFEILDQTIYKQKRLARAKKSPDMRLKVLLKRTFDLVCEIMDRENGIDDSLSDSSSGGDEDERDLDDIELELSPERDRELCARLDIETCNDTTCLTSTPHVVEQSPPGPNSSGTTTTESDSDTAPPRRPRRPSRFSDGPTPAAPVFTDQSSVLAPSGRQETPVDNTSSTANRAASTHNPSFVSDLAESAFYDECAKLAAPPAAAAAYEITVQVDEAYFARSLKHEFEREDEDDETARHVRRTPKRRRSSDDDSDSDEDDEHERYAVEITRLPAPKRLTHRHDKRRRIY